MRCMNKTTRQRYAVKIVYSKHDVSREVEALRACQGHPNIVQLHDVLRDERHTYILMELLAGGELFDRIREARRFTEKEASMFFKQIVQAVQYMHQKNIAHRDLKAENIIFTSHNSKTLKLVDFGFARQNSNSGMTTPCFTLDYAAPEVLIKNSVLNADTNNEAEPYTAASDLWSLGVILYTMLCGQTPFSPKKQAQASIPNPIPAEVRVRSIVERIQLGDIETGINEWQMVSDVGKRLVCGLLTVDTRKRLTMSQLLNHEWLGGEVAKDRRTVLQAEVKDPVGQRWADSALVYRRHTRRKPSQKNGYGDEERGQIEKSLESSNSSSGVVTFDGNNHSLSVDSSDVEIVGVYEKRPEIKIPNPTPVTASVEAVADTPNDTKPLDNVDSSTVDAVSPQEVSMHGTGLPNIVKEDEPDRDKTTVVDLRQMDGVHYFESEGEELKSGLTKGKERTRVSFRPRDEALFRGFEFEQDRMDHYRELMSVYARECNTIDGTRSTTKRVVKKRKRPDNFNGDEPNSKVVRSEAEAFLERTQGEFEKRKINSRVQVPVTAAMNSGPMERPKSKRIDWNLFAERRCMPTRAGRKTRRPEVDSPMWC